MIVVGLTGGIGMGKSTAARAFQALGVPVFDSDRAVRLLQAPGGAAVRPIGTAFPDAVADGRIDRGALRQAVAARPEALRRLEAIVHPLVRRCQRRFLARMRRAGRPIVVLDVPLLFEAGGDALCDYVVVVSAPPAVQRQRVRRRRSMAEAEVAALIARQMPDADKRRRADAVVRTGLSRGESRRQIVRIVDALRRKHRP